MQELDDPEEKKLVSVEVTNRGDRPTTLTHLAFYGYANWLSKTIKRRNKKVGIVYRPGGGQGLPFVLAPGERWLGLAEQKIIAEYYQDQYLYAAICHSGSSRDSLCRVQLGW